MKYVLFQSSAAQELLFDLTQDPGERSNLAGTRGDAAANLSSRLNANHAENRRWNEAIRLGKESELDPQLKETLKGLGYVQ